MRVDTSDVRLEMYLELPAHWQRVCSAARLDERIGVRGAGHAVFGVAFYWPAEAEHPAVVVTQGVKPGPESGFHPGVLVVRETGVAFVGAGTRVLGYNLPEARRLWEDEADTGFWGWDRHGDVVVMSAELACAAWSTSGLKLWSTFVEPPWSYKVDGPMMSLDVMGTVRAFPLATGPKRP